MDVVDIVEKYLKDNGYDGLAGDQCGCLIGDLFICETGGTDCQPGYKVPCIASECLYGGDCDWHVSTTKP